MTARSKTRLAKLACALSIALLARNGSRAATQPVDLDAQPTNGAESQCEVNVLQTFPVQIENRVTNRTGNTAPESGDAFNFVWSSAGPGGFSSSTIRGNSAGIGAKWLWTTNQSVSAFTGNSCANDICFSKTLGSDVLAGLCSLCTEDGVAFSLAKSLVSGEAVLSWVGGQGPYGIYRSTNVRTIADPANRLTSTDGLRFTDFPPAGTIFFYQVRGSTCVARESCASDADCAAPVAGSCFHRGPFAVPGRSLFSTDVTVSAASLTSSLITFFSPPTEVFRATSSAGPGGVTESVTNFGGNAVLLTIPASPPGCCPEEEGVYFQIKCGETCVDILTDEHNCGECGNECLENTYCDWGSCDLDCGKLGLECNGACIDWWEDENNCGDCGIVCAEGETCEYGYCQVPCEYPWETYCGGKTGCVDLNSDVDNCGYCDYACPIEGSCCFKGYCQEPCDYPRTYCNGECVDFDNDAANCGACGNDCGEGSCCQYGKCISLVCDTETLPPEPPYWELCGDQCVHLINNNNNCGSCGHVCTEGTCCNGEGTCNSVCYEDQDRCGDQCTQVANDSANCGECGTVCGAGTCCNDGGCVPLTCNPFEELCEEGCVDTNTDIDNCGECGAVCNYGCCVEGICEDSGGGLAGCPGSPPHPPDFCPNETPVTAEPLHCPTQEVYPATCPNPDASSGEATNCDTARPPRQFTAHISPPPYPLTPAHHAAPPPPEKGGAPICDVLEHTVEIPGCTTPPCPPITTRCTPGGPLFYEASTAITVCGGGTFPGVDGQCPDNSQKMTTGTFNRLVDTGFHPETAYVTPYKVHVISDTTGDGLLEPGETAEIVVELLNAGPLDLTNPIATLAFPGVDLDGGDFNPIDIAVDGGAVSYGPILPKAPGAGPDCTALGPLEPKSNSPAFQIAVPADHPGDTSHPGILSVSGLVNDEAFSMDVYFSLGIADTCNPAAHTGDYDVLIGLVAGMAQLVPAGETVPFPPHSFEAGKKRMLRLRTKCRNMDLSNTDVDPPEIVSLFKAGNPTNLAPTLFDERQQAVSRFFTWQGLSVSDPPEELDDNSWEYELRTTNLSPGTYTMTIRIAGRKDYVTGFVLH